jgi:hypothetical protein
MTKIRSRPPLPSDAAIDSGRWMKWCKLIPLPDQARRELEDAIALYRTNENARLPAASVRASLLGLARTASRLATLIDGLGDREHYELIEASDGLSGLGNCHEFLASARSRTALLGTWSAAAAAQFTERLGSNPIWLHSLVRDLDEIVWRHTGQRIKRSEKWEPWVHEICRFAAPNIKPGSVAGALRAITKGRGKINQRKRSTILPHTTVK